MRDERQGQVYHPPQQADYQVFVENAMPTVGVYPVVVGETSVSLVEVFLPPNLSDQVLNAFTGKMEILCEIAGGFHRAAGTSTASGDEPIRALTSAVHRSLDVEATCYALANEGRRALGCDRVSVLTGRPGKYRLRAVSGQESINRRDNVVRLLEQLSQAVLATAEPFWYPVDDKKLAPQIEEVLEQYIETSMSRQLGILPLCPEIETEFSSEDGEVPERKFADPIGAIVVEDFVAKTDAQLLAIENRCPCFSVYNEWSY